MTHVADLLARDRPELSLTERRELDAHLASCGRCRDLQADLAATDRLLRGREPDVTSPPFDRALRPRERAMPFVLATAGALVVLAVLVLAPILLGGGEQGVAQRVPIASSTGLATATLGPRATATPPGTFENATMGYRITLPTSYHRSVNPVPGDPRIRDVFTTLSDAEERAECARDSGDIGSPTDRTYLFVEVYANERGQSALDFANSSLTKSAGAKVEAVPAIDGHDAARAVEFGKPSWYVIRANDRIYWIGAHNNPTQAPLESIAASFTVMPAQPLPTPTPPIAARRDALNQAATALAQAFSARDADAIARLVAPSCSMAAVQYVDGAPSGSALNIASGPFIDRLRTALATRELSVTVDPAVQVRSDAGGDHYYVRSQWTDSRGAKQVDLYFEYYPAGWRWFQSVHQYRRADLVNGCVPFRNPWVSGDKSC